MRSFPSKAFTVKVIEFEMNNRVIFNFFLFIFVMLFDECWTKRNKEALNLNFFKNRRVFFSGNTCLGENGNQGNCMTIPACSKQQGTPIGVCGLFETCCALSTCNIRTNARISQFVNPSMLTSGTECSYNIEINNENICQMRIDLEMFSLSQPTTTIVPGSTGRGYECKDDEFEITGHLPGDDIPILCGENTNQHLYVRVNASMNIRNIVMNVKSVDRTNRPELSLPSWRIKVTQLECYNTFRKFREVSALNILPNIKSTIARDEYFLAPPGCLQYYPDRSGTIETFNYNNGIGPYIGNLFYSMCFRRQPNICGVRLTISRFQLANIVGNAETDSGCTTSVTIGDYLFTPEALSSTDVKITSMWCGTSLNEGVIAVTPPGPLYIHFKSDDLVTDSINEYGFRLTYNLMNNCN